MNIPNNLKFRTKYAAGAWLKLRCVIVFLFCFPLCPTWHASLAAQDAMPDKVVVAVGGRISTKETISGEILEYNGEILRIQTSSSGEPKEYQAADVVEVFTQQAQQHSKGLEQFQQKDYPAAAKSLRDAFDSESRIWVRREILAALIRCHLMQGDYRNAATRFAILIKSDPRTRSFPLIPLIWRQTRLDPDLRSKAEGWLLDDNEFPAVRLVGASLLLEDAQFGTSATVLLKELAANKDRRVGVLAACQLWRLRLASRTEVNLTELKSWSQRLETLPNDLRSGPHFLLGRAYVSRREFELAAVHFLWQPLVQPDDHFLAAQATLDAADALNAIGQVDAALLLYEEIVAGFSATPASQEAAGQIKKLTQSPE